MHSPWRVVNALKEQHLLIAKTAFTCSCATSQLPMLQTVAQVVCGQSLTPGMAKGALILIPVVYP